MAEKRPKAMGGHKGRGMRPTEKLEKGMIKRFFKMMFSFYPVLLPLVIVLIIFSAIVSSIPSIFMQKILDIVEKAYLSGDWESVKSQILGMVCVLVTLYVISIISNLSYMMIMAGITQGSLKKIRIAMFEKMQKLPIRYFDSNNTGDIMSRYTNDADALRQMISQSMPQLLTTVVTITTVLGIMIYYSINLLLVVLAGVACMAMVTKKIGGGSAKYFVKQQKAIGKTEGYIEEMVNGSKVVKVFSHEAISKEEFDKLNEELYSVARRANTYANILMPILGNLGNVLYVLVALAGGAMLLSGAGNFSLSGMAMSISIAVPFLNMTKQFTGNISNISNQVNSVAMALAGAQRVFRLLDEEEELDEGYVKLVNVYEKNGELIKTDKKTGQWAWEHPHQADGSVTYTPLAGDIVLDMVDFSYVSDKQVLYDISLYARPGQKIAFVGSTGAGKTTITNLLNRFYDIADGKIRYDGININKISKSDLRHAVGMVLQETNLFTGTVMENIRYGRLDATDEECIAAAKLAGAHDFIEGLTDGYNTMLTNNAENLSQGQRQLLSIARVAVCDPPVMILDEATSSIDTRTEAIVQKGMDALMMGRTTFVIAHRLSTVRNANVIIVLEKGHIIERGTHDELIAAKGQYYKLYTGAFELE